MAQPISLLHPARGTTPRPSRPCAAPQSVRPSCCARTTLDATPCRLRHQRGAALKTPPAFPLCRPRAPSLYTFFVPTRLPFRRALCRVTPASSPPPPAPPRDALHLLPASAACLTGRKYGSSCASFDVSRSWWSYRNSLSKKSIASEDTRCWLSAFTNFDPRGGCAEGEPPQGAGFRV